MGTSWISSFATVKPGDSVVIDYTLYNSNGYPLITTDLSQYQQAMSTGMGLIYAKQITLAANQSWPAYVYPVQIYTAQGGWSKQFAIFSMEYNAISSGVVGMKANQKKRISFPDNGTMIQFFSAASLQQNNVNSSELAVGDSLSMGVSDTPELARQFLGYLCPHRAGNPGITGCGVTVDFGYPGADITVTSINNR